MEMANLFSMLRPVPYMGVIWVVHEASKHGFWNGHPDWCNLGQGQPEVADLPGAPPRLSSLMLESNDHAYGPIGGTFEVRQAVSDTVNRLYRRGMKSQYTANNVSFACGGRLALTRLFSILADESRILYKSPDYTAYEDYLNYCRHRCVLLPLTAEENDCFSIPPERLDLFIRQEKVDAFIFSNPCNPTGDLVLGQDLERYVSIARKYNCLFGIDEFYSHFIYKNDGSPADCPISAAAYVKDVEKDPVIILDGLTKNHRYPGWRAGWALGPSHCIEMINRAASALDGGPSMLVQRATMQALEASRADQETQALRSAFAKKRLIMLGKLGAMGIKPVSLPLGTFYVWASIRELQKPLNDADIFFHSCLKHKVMTVPGRFFDVRPHRVRPRDEPYRSYVRFSYGPSEEVVVEGLRRIAEVVSDGCSTA